MLQKNVLFTKLQCVKMKGNSERKKQKKVLLCESLILFYEWMGVWPICTV